MVNGDRCDKRNNLAHFLLYFSIGLASVPYRDNEQLKESVMKITVEIKNVYGNRLVYPACDQARTFCSLVGSKTLTQHHLNEIKALGYSVEVQTPTL